MRDVAVESRGRVHRRFAGQAFGSAVVRGFGAVSRLAGDLGAVGRFVGLLGDGGSHLLALAQRLFAHGRASVGDFAGAADGRLGGIADARHPADDGGAQAEPAAFFAIPYLLGRGDRVACVSDLADDGNESDSDLAGGGGPALVVAEVTRNRAFGEGAEAFFRFGLGTSSGVAPLILAPTRRCVGLTQILFAHLPALAHAGPGVSGRGRVGGFVARRGRRNGDAIARTQFAPTGGGCGVGRRKCRGLNAPAGTAGRSGLHDETS